MAGSRPPTGRAGRGGELVDVDVVAHVAGGLTLGEQVAEELRELPLRLRSPMWLGPLVVEASRNWVAICSMPGLAWSSSWPS